MTAPSPSLGTPPALTVFLAELGTAAASTFPARRATHWDALPWTCVARAGSSVNAEHRDAVAGSVTEAFVVERSKPGLGAPVKGARGLRRAGVVPAATVQASAAGREASQSRTLASAAAECATGEEMDAPHWIASVRRIASQPMASRALLLAWSPSGVFAEAWAVGRALIF